MNLPFDTIQSFREQVWSFFAINRRLFPWRYVEDPYKVVVSEVMLQQTQTSRVLPKYELFINTFASFTQLAHASLPDVLGVWQGLGYNRRAKYLHELAKLIVAEYHGELPNNPDLLITFPGIGKYTAASICAFAYNNPTVFIETNIRAVYIYSFFNDQENVHDKQLFPLIQQTLDSNSPREWYYALMDYGVYLKKWFKNPAKKSAHHTQQSKFEGSDRQIRGMIIKLLLIHHKISTDELYALLQKERNRIDIILQQLISEQLVFISDSFIMIANSN